MAPPLSRDPKSERVGAFTQMAQTRSTKDNAKHEPSAHPPCFFQMYIVHVSRSVVTDCSLCSLARRRPPCVCTQGCGSCLHIAVSLSNFVKRLHTLPPEGLESRRHSCMPSGAVREKASSARQPFSRIRSHQRVLEAENRIWLHRRVTVRLRLCACMHACRRFHNVARYD